MNLIVLCSGAGSRFKKDFDLPKPFILFKDKPLFYWSTESALNSFFFKKTYFVYQKSMYPIAVKRVKVLYPDSELIFLDHLTSGAAESAFLSIENISNNLPIAFLDCDMYFRLDNKITLDFINYDACCLTFKSSNLNYSYAEIENNFVKRTAEKKVISDNAITGCYIFKNKSTFVNSYEEYIKNCSYKELYLSGIFNTMITNGNRIRSIPVNFNIPLGTPEELKIAYINNL